MPKDEVVKNEIVIEAQKLFRQYGVKKTTMDEIAAACMKAKSTLYHYFKSKEEVFDEVVNMELRNLRKSIKGLVDAEPNLQKKLTVYFFEFHRRIVDAFNLSRVLKHELQNELLGKIQFQKIMKFERSFLTRLMEDGFDVGEYNVVKKEDIPFIAEIMLASFLGIVRYAIEIDGRFDHEKLRSSVQSIIPRLIT